MAAILEPAHSVRAAVQPNHSAAHTSFQVLMALSAAGESVWMMNLGMASLRGLGETFPWNICMEIQKCLYSSRYTVGWSNRQGWRCGNILWQCYEEAGPPPVSLCSDRPACWAVQLKWHYEYGEHAHSMCVPTRYQATNLAASFECWYWASNTVIFASDGY